MKTAKAIPAITVVLFFLLFFASGSAWATENDFLKEGLDQYKAENYEEAAEILENARRQNPKSSTAAFFLGLTYKQLFEYQKAADQFRSSLSLEPKIKEALVELIEVLYRIKTEKSLKEAKSWIAVAEREGIFPAKVAFLEGLILQQEGENQEAIRSFERSIALDPSFRQSAEIQIAMCYMRDRELAKAKEKLQTAIQIDPATDLAGFARRYQDLVERRMELEKPLRVTLGVFPQYDDNVVLNPEVADVVFGPTDESSALLRTSLRLDYVPIFKGPWLFNAQYAFLGSFYEEKEIRKNYNSMINSFRVSPGYNFGRFSLNLPVSYNHVIVADDGDDDVYLETWNSGPLLRTVVGNSHLLELYAAYNKEDYHRTPLSPEEDRDSEGLQGYVSWYWTYKEGGFANFKYEYKDFDADGDNYDRQVHRMSLNIIHPIVDKLSLQLSGQFSLEPYDHIHSVTKIPAPRPGVPKTYVARTDDIYQTTAGLTWEFYKNTDLVLQWSYTKSDSNIDLFSYDRNLYTCGIEYRF
ncbi:MAG: tetratricopeptide repeat protein [Desulfobacterales bacterium]|nr:tetratricopeptide repeat protein [Desulfobacterales bacterium]